MQPWKKDIRFLAAQASMLRTIAVLGSLLALTFAPHALATSSCAPTQSDAPAYLVTDGAEFVVYAESNGLAGLQAEPCLDGAGQPRPADSRVASGPPTVRPCVGSICVL